MSSELTPPLLAIQPFLDFGVAPHLFCQHDSPSGRVPVSSQCPWQATRIIKRCKSDSPLRDNRVHGDVD